jgi:hypothetical protein
MLKYLSRVGIALSILINVILGGASNQTFSARNWQWKKDNRFNLVCAIDLVLGKDHCAGCWINWQIRKPK